MERLDSARPGPRRLLDPQGKNFFGAEPAAELVLTGLPPSLLSEGGRDERALAGDAPLYRLVRKVHHPQDEDLAITASPGPSTRAKD